MIFVIWRFGKNAVKLDGQSGSSVKAFRVKKHIGWRIKWFVHQDHLRQILGPWNKFYVLCICIKIFEWWEIIHWLHEGSQKQDKGTQFRTSWINQKQIAHGVDLLRSLSEQKGCLSQGKVSEVNLWQTILKKQAQGIFNRLSGRLWPFPFSREYQVL